METSRMLPYLVVEIANSHGGNLSIVENLIEEFAALDYERKGMNCKRFNCEGTIQKIKISNRSTFFCNTCQK